MTRYAPPVKQPQQRNPRAPKPFRLTRTLARDAVWLDDAAVYWLEQGRLLVWHWNAAERRCTGFTVYVEATGEKVAEVRLVEVT